jgi:hypothetical protein
LLFLGKDPFSTSKVDVKLYNVTFYYIDIDGDKTRIASDSCLKQVINNPPHKRNEKDDFKYDRQFYTEPGEVKVFAGVEKKHNQESSTLGSAAESSIQTVHSARSISLTTPQTNELRHLLIKLALAGFGGKLVNSSASLKRLRAQLFAPVKPSCIIKPSWHLPMYRAVSSIFDYDSMHHG